MSITAETVFNNVSLNVCVAVREAIELSVGINHDKARPQLELSSADDGVTADFTKLHLYMSEISDNYLQEYSLIRIFKDELAACETAEELAVAKARAVKDIAKLLKVINGYEFK